jgi:hypothetical protein
MPPFSDLRSDYPLNFICFGPPYQRVLDGSFEASSLVCGFLAEVYRRATGLYCTLCYSPVRSTQWSGLHKEDAVRFVERPTATGCVLPPTADAHRSIHEHPFEPWLIASNGLQRLPGVNATRERLRAELLLTLALHLDVDQCIQKFYLNDVSGEDENAIVRRCPTQISMLRVATPDATSAVAARRIAPYPNPNNKRKEPVMPNSRGHLRFEPLFTTEEIGLHKEASIEHVMKVFLNVGEGIASRWIEMPKCVLLLQSVPDSPASGAIYLYDRERHVFYLIVFEQGRDDTLTTAEFEELVAEYDLLGCAENPRILMPLSSLGNA